MAFNGRPVHIVTVNDYLVQRDAEEMGPIYRMMGHQVGFVVHETTPMERVDHYRRNIVYNTNKELVADFLRDQIMLGTLRTSTQTAVGLLMQGEMRSRADGAGALAGDRGRGRQPADRPKRSRR